MMEQGWKRYGIAIAVASMLAGAAHAEPGSSAYVRGGIVGPVFVDAAYQAPSGCWYIAGAGRGAPAGVSPGTDVAVTVRFASKGTACGPGRVLHIVTRVSANIGSIVRVYFVAPDGRIVKTERVSVSTG
ncbi:MAG: hypothetical protein AB7L41_13405 [Flavobacteriaceae bacterium]